MAQAGRGGDPCEAETCVVSIHVTVGYGRAGSCGRACAGGAPHQMERHRQRQGTSTQAQSKAVARLHLTVRSALAQAARAAPKACSRSTSTVTLECASSRAAAGITASNENRHSFPATPSAASAAATSPPALCTAVVSTAGPALEARRCAAWSVGERRASTSDAAGSRKRENARGSWRAAACSEEAAARRKSRVAGAVRSCGTRTCVPAAGGSSGARPEACSAAGWGDHAFHITNLPGLRSAIGSLPRLD